MDVMSYRHWLDAMQGLAVFFAADESMVTDLPVELL